MDDELLAYYERELTYLRQSGSEFAAKYPKIASRLLLEQDKSEDPHVERLIQAVAFLAARVHRKIADEFPEITDALLGVLYPHYLAPVPSLAIVQFVLDPEQGQLTTGHRIDRGATLYSPPVGGQPCRFRTCYPVTLWPVDVAGAHLEVPARLGPSLSAPAAIRLQIKCVGGVPLAELNLTELRFFIAGEDQLAFSLYEVLFNNVREVQLRGLGGASQANPVVLPPHVVRPVGFNADEGLLPYSNRSLMGYRLLQEYFTFPKKFLFFDLCQLDRAAGAGCTDGMEVLFLLDRPPQFEQSIGVDTFRLGCTPIVNLFEQTAEPIRLSHTQTEYRVIPDVRRQQATEVYSVDEVFSTSGDGQEPVAFRPFYSVRHGGAPSEAYWCAARRPSQNRLDPGTEVYLSLVDLDFNPTQPAVETLTVRTTCTNRDLPGKLPFGGDRATFELEGAAPLSRIRTLTKPTETLRPPLRNGLQWRLISHLSLNHLSICEGGPEPLQEILRLYDAANSTVTQQHIAGITNVSSRRVVARPASLPGHGYCRGLEVTLEFDEDKYVGSGVFLFASVLERFFGLYASLNSFVQLVAKTRQREEPLRRWPPRLGEQILL